MSLQWLDEEVQEEAREETDKVEYSRFFFAQFSNGKNVLSQLLISHPEFGRYQPHADNPIARVDRTEIIRIGGSQDIWRVRVDYSTLIIPQDKNPLERPAEVDFSEASHTRITLVDGEDNPILNSAGDLIDDPPCEIDDADLVVSVAKNISPKLPSWLRTYRRSVNEDAVRIEGETFDPLTLRFRLKSLGKKETENDVDFRALSFELHFREGGWNQQIPNRGLFQLIPKKSVMSTGSGDFQGRRVKTQSVDRVRIKCGWPPEFPAEPQMLDKNGRLIEQRDSAGNLLQYPTVDNIVILDKLLFRKLPYDGVLPLK